jgi:Asp-tRNA(Asn)/Glu-tRNA(Gln) amidotransferase A subunit family amidase
VVIDICEGDKIGSDTVEDTASMLQAIAGPDPKDPTSSRALVPDYSAALKEDLTPIKSPEKVREK